MQTSHRKSAAIGLLTIGIFTWTMPAFLLAQPAAPEKAAATAPKADLATTRDRDLYGDPLPAGARMRLGTIRYRQDSRIDRIVYTPDGKHFLTDGEDSILRVWDADTGRVIRRIDPDVGVMEDFALSSKGGLIMATGITLDDIGSGVRHVTMTELKTGRIADRGSWRDATLGSDPLALCPDRQLIAVGLDEGIVRILDARTGVETRRIEPRKGEIERVVLSPDGERIAVETETDLERGDRDLRLYNIDSGKEVRVIRESGWNYAEDVIFSPDGNTIATTTYSDLHVWRIGAGDDIPFLHANANCVSYSGDGRILAGIGAEGRLGIFNLATRRMDSSFATDSTNLENVALSPDGRVLVTSDGSCVLHSWEIKEHRDRFAMPHAHKDSVNRILCTPDGKTLITASGDRTIRLWDLATGRQKRELKHPNHVEMMALSRDGRWLVAPIPMHVYSQIFIWDLQGDAPIVVPGRPHDPETFARPVAVGLVDDDRTFLLVNREGKMHGWDLRERRAQVVSQPQLSPPSDHSTRGAAFLSDGKTLLMLGDSSGLHFIDVPTGKERSHFDVGANDSLVLSPDERIVAIATSAGVSRPTRHSRFRKIPKTGSGYESTAGIIKLLESVTAKEVHRIAVPDSQVWALAFSPDGKTLAATSGWETGQVHLYEVATGKEIRTIATPALHSPALAFTPDGKRLVTGMADASILIWDLPTNP